MLMVWLASAAYSQRLMLMVAADAAVAVYMLLVVMPLAAGRPRLVAAAPIVVVNVMLPLLFTAHGEIPSLVASAFNNCWCSPWLALQARRLHCHQRTWPWARPRRLWILYGQHVHCTSAIVAYSAACHMQEGCCEVHDRLGCSFHFETCM